MGKLSTTIVPNVLLLDELVVMFMLFILFIYLVQFNIESESIIYHPTPTVHLLSHRPPAHSQPDSAGVCSLRLDYPCF